MDEGFLNILKGEIEWCKENTILVDNKKEFAEGFIKGLEQALDIYKKYEEIGEKE